MVGALIIRKNVFDSKKIRKKKGSAAPAALNDIRYTAAGLDKLQDKVSMVADGILKYIVQYRVYVPHDTAHSANAWIDGWHMKP